MAITAVGQRKMQLQRPMEERETLTVCKFQEGVKDSLWEKMVLQQRRGKEKGTDDVHSEGGVLRGLLRLKNTRETRVLGAKQQRPGRHRQSSRKGQIQMLKLSRNCQPLGVFIRIEDPVIP